MGTASKEGAKGGKRVPVTLDAKRVSFLGEGSSRDGAVSYSVVIDVPPAAQDGEQRRTARQRARLHSGKVVDIDNHFLTECVFHNRSTAGARLRLSRQVEVPRVIKVYDDQSGALVPAYVVWHRKGEVGVRFEPHLDLTEARRTFISALGDKFYAIPD